MTLLSILMEAFIHFYFFLEFRFTLFLCCDFVRKVMLQRREKIDKLIGDVLIKSIKSFVANSIYHSLSKISIIWFSLTRVVPICSLKRWKMSSNQMGSYNKICLYKEESFWMNLINFVAKSSVESSSASPSSRSKSSTFSWKTRLSSGRSFSVLSWEDWQISSSSSDSTVKIHSWYKLYIYIVFYILLYLKRT